MKKIAKKYKAILAIAIAMTASSAFAQAAPPITVSTPNTFAGTSVSLFGINGVSPYHNVTSQDMLAVMTGYGLTLPNTASNQQASQVPFIVNPSGDSSGLPTISGSNATATDLMIGSMLVPLSQDNLKNYLYMTNAAFLPPTLTANSSYAGSSIANIKAPDKQDYTVTAGFAAPYNVASLFHYVPAEGSGNKTTPDPAAYQTNPANVYVALASGVLTPQSSPNNAGPDYMIQLRRLAAIQSAGVYALQDILKRSQPLSGANEKVYETLSNGACPKKDAQGNPLTERDLEKCMATRRLDPASGWYNHLQHASPTELQREQLYLQSEILYELYQLHHTEEVNEALLADTLLSQNYNNRAYLNQQQQMSQVTGKK